MDCSWIRASKLSDEYENEVDQYLEFAERNLLDSKGIFYFPCKICGIMNKYGNK